MTTSEQQAAIAHAMSNPCDHLTAEQRTAQQHALADAIEALPAPARTVFVMRFVQHLNPTAIAAQLRIPEGEVRTQLVAALRLLRGHT